MMIIRLKAILVVLALAGSLVHAQTHFQYRSNTGNNATVIVPTTAQPDVNGVPLVSGDEIGVFSTAGLCVGAVVWSGSNTAITVWGDDTQTPEVDGIQTGDTIRYRIWKQSTNTEYPSVTVTYLQGNGRYAADGLYTLSTIDGWAPPAAPSLVSPADAATNIPTSPVFSWNSVSYAESYRLQVSVNANFTSTQINQTGISATSFTASGLSNSSTYYWRVSAANSGGEGAYSPVRSFATVEAPPPAPTLSSPADGSVNQPTSMTLSWNPAARADKYWLQVSTVQAFTQTIVNDSSLTSPSRSVGSLSSGTTYYWRVRGVGDGGAGNWSAVWAFTTLPEAPSPPTLSSPANHASDQPTSVTLSWNQSPGADWYRVQLSTTPGFTTVVVNDSVISSSRSVQSLQLDTRYYWRILAGNEGGTSPWSEVWDFTTIPPAPAAPALSAPANGTVDQQRTLTLSWTSVQGATGYALQVSTDQSFATVQIDESSLTTTSKEVGPLGYGTRYYWRVRAWNGGGTSPWSGPWNFTTVPGAPAAPALLSPPDAAEDQPTTLELRWTSASGASRYRLQVSTSLSFTSTVIDSPAVTTTSKTVGPLSNATQFYWRVQASNDAGSSGWSDIRTFTTIPAPPTTPVLQSPTDESTDQPTTIILTWAAAQEASKYHVQLSSDQSFASPIVNDSSLGGTSRQVGSLSNSTAYFWRVRALNAGGSSSWTPAWKFTTTSGLPAPPAAPTLATPANGSTGIPIPATLTWGASSGASSYQLHLSRQSDFSSIDINDSTISSTSKQIDTLLYSTRYHWRIRARNQGGASPWSSAWSFTTAAAPPAAPVLVTPQDNAEDIPVSVTLKWNATPGAASYHAQISTRSDFATVLYENSTLSDTLVQPGGLNNSTRYYWRIRASNGEGTGPWSVPFTFSTVLSAPVAPTPVRPADGSQSESIQPLIAWTPSPGAASYRIQVSRTASFNGSTILNESIQDTSIRLSDLLYSTTYYWRVNAENAGGTSPWTAIWSFKTFAPPPPAPGLVSPPDNAAHQPTALDLAWNAAANSNSYRVQLSENGSFQPLHMDSIGITTTQLSVSGLEYDRTYHWRVLGSNQAGDGPWSSSRKFSTASKDPLAPDLSSPPNGATGVPTDPTLTWNAVAGATGYDLQVSTRTDFSDLDVNQSNLSTTSHHITGLAQGTVYYWRVRSRNVAGSSGWSSVWNFTTVLSTPGTATLVHPAEGARDLTLTPQLSWNPVSGATSYRAQVSLTPGFSTVVFDSAGIGSTNASVRALNPATIYYWRIIASNSAGSGPASVVRSFVTHDPSQESHHDVVVQYPPAVNAKAHDYRLFGLPGPLRTNLRSLVSGTFGTDWKAYWDNGQPANYFIELNGESPFLLGEGRGIWIIHNGPLAVEMMIPPIPLNAAEEAEIPLHGGWNIITNPFPSTVSWSVVRSINGVTVPLWHFEGGFTSSDTLKPFCGYYFDNASGLTTLRIPKPNGTPGAAPSSRADERSWLVHIRFTSGTAFDRSAAFGIHPDASAGFDRYDARSPRFFEHAPSVTFVRGDWQDNSPTFARDIRESVGSLQIWPFDVSSFEREPGVLMFEGLERIPGDLDVVLVDHGRGVTSDLRLSPRYEFVPSETRSSMEVLVGTPNEIRGATPSFSIPNEITLGSNYPNPFNPSTKIPLSVPGESEITLAVYNALGQEIAMVYRGLLHRGSYVFTWDGKDSNGHEVSTGLYFFRLSSGATQKIGKMLLVR